VGARIAVGDTSIVVTFTGRHRLLCGRRCVEIARDCIVHAVAAERRPLEQAIDHRVIGEGAHDGERHPGRTRIGTMMGSSRAGRQLWAVDQGPLDERLLVLDLRDHRYVRAVLAVPDPDAMAEGLSTAEDAAGPAD
jgi:hypothetical protein